MGISTGFVWKLTDRNAYHLIDSPYFFERLNYLKDTQFCSKEGKEASQILNLQKQLFTASKFVPFYIEFFKKNSLHWQDFSSLNDLKILPIISKEDIRENYSNFLNKNFNKDELIMRNTGGSSGSTLSIYSDDIFISRDKANTFYYMDVLKLNPFKDKSIRLYGDVVAQNLLKSEFTGRKN